MFIDVCYSDDAEASIKIAKWLKTDGLVMDKKPKTGFPIHKLKILPLENIRKNTAYFYKPVNKPSFHYPARITQVAIKELKQKNCILGVSFKEIMQNPLCFEETSFAARLAQKYELPLFIASFAAIPYELRGRKELAAILNLMGLNTQTVNKAFNVLHSFVE